MSAPSRLTILGHGAERTGPPVHLLRVLRWIAANAPEVEVDVGLLRDGPLLDATAALAPVTVVGPEPTRSVAGLGRHADIVLVNTAGSIAALPALDQPPRVLVTHVHELAEGFSFHLSPALRRSVLERSDALLAVSRAVASMLRTHVGEAAAIPIHAGFVEPEQVAAAAADPVTRAELGAHHGEVVIAACGTLDWRKAPDLFVAALARLVASGIPARGVWIGGDPSGAVGTAARRDADALGLGDRVRFVGEQPDPIRWMAAADVFVLTAREDAFPLVGLEAAALGLPTVCFDAGGLPELVSDDAGTVVAYPDVDAMARALAGLATDPARRTALGTVARERVLARHVPDVAVPALLGDLATLAATAAR